MDFRSIRLDETHDVLVGRLPEELTLDPAAFEQLWAMHPDDFHEIKIHGRLVRTPRWQQAYGMDYHYTGRVNRALPVVSPLDSWLAWSCGHFGVQFNAMLLNWYDGTRGHYIGKHRDSDVNRVEGTPIVTLSFGEERAFRFRPWRKDGFRDLTASNGSVIVIPWETNRRFTHEVPATAAARGRRISVTIRAFHA